MFKRKARPPRRRRRKLPSVVSVWASVGARVTFRAEVMPGRDRAERTFTVARVLSNGRIELTGLTGEHAETEFESRQSA